MKHTILKNVLISSTKSLLLASCLIVISCGDFLEDYSQDTAYVRSYEDLDELLLGDGYMPTGNPVSIGMDDEYITSPWYYPYVHLMSDELEQNTKSYTGTGSLYDVGSKFFGYYTWQQQVGMNPEGTQIGKEDADWNRIYKHINIANMVIANIDDQPGDDTNDIKEKQRIKGEAYFLRGAYYFTLANLYGKSYKSETAKTDLAVPIKLTEFIEDKDFNRNTVDEVYQQAISDLEQAEVLLQNANTKSYFRANAEAADLLLSRLYLYMQNWDKAVEYGQKVITNNNTRMENLNTMSESFFLNPNLPEVIFTMGNGGARSFISGNIKDFGVSDYLSNLYSSDDLRNEYFIKYDTSLGYTEFVKGGVMVDLKRSALSSNFLLRLSEAYLNVAEAAAYKDDYNLALQTINALRKNRIKATDYQDIVLSGNELIDFIRDERERELCLEGHRWFDLRRYAVNDKYPTSKVIRHGYTTFTYDWHYGSMPSLTKYYELEAFDDAYTLPIPKEVVNFSNGMPNNTRKKREVVETINY